MLNIHLVGLDLDGTLLDDNRQIRPRTIAALRLAADSGIHLAVISGRNFLAVPEALRVLPLIRYYVLCNGAALYDAQEDAILHRTEIPLKDAVQMYRSLEKEDVYYDCYLNDGAWTQQDHYERIDEFVPVESHRAFLKVSRKPFPNLCDALIRRGKPVWKVQAIYKSTEIRDREMARLREEFSQYSICSAYPYNLEFNTYEANKGSGLMRLAQILSIDPMNVMAFGDGGNDVTMLHNAGVGVAMGNASFAAKNAANYIGPANNDDGVAQVLELLVAWKQVLHKI